MAHGAHGDLPSRYAGLWSCTGPFSKPARAAPRVGAGCTCLRDRVVHPEFGKRGAAIAVRSNLFTLKYLKDVVLYDYPVVITSNAICTAARKRVSELLECTQEVAPYFREIAHHWTQRLVSRSRLPADFSATVSERPKRAYTVKVLEPKELHVSNVDLDRQALAPLFSSLRTARARTSGIPRTRRCAVS
ncbi:hypothetical protein DFH11DRAFT_532930 [Phellopilus nigrolimitatus]|nr:hypothetical protein DFH11DRAFT_532930 [Phellopilus nigrolimitatus]